MGWTSHELPNPGWRLWTRGGTKGVYLDNDDKRQLEIHIPASLLQMLVADDVRDHRMSQLESMEDKELLGLE